MAFELKEGSGTLFKNDRKDKPGHPDYRGEINVDGEIMELAAWIKTSAKGTKWMSISMKPKKSAAAPTRESTMKAVQDLDSDLPF